MGNIEYHVVCRALQGDPDTCGDMGLVITSGELCFLGLVDVLGHGKAAWIVACSARAYLEEHFLEEPGELLQGLHRHLKGTRGAVVALCCFNRATGELIHTGIGNISVKIIGTEPFSFVPRDGVVGYIAPTPRITSRKLHPDDLLLMHSDGIREHFNPLECADIFSENAENIATGLLERYGKNDDDASCIVLRYLR